MCTSGSKMNANELKPLMDTKNTSTTVLTQAAVSISTIHLCHCVGGLFDYVSCANYFGEALEWTGYAIACWNPAAAQFAIWTTLFLCSRSLQHHRSDQPLAATAIHCNWGSVLVLHTIIII